MGQLRDEWDPSAHVAAGRERSGRLPRDRQNDFTGSRIALHLVICAKVRALQTLQAKVAVVEGLNLNRLVSQLSHHPAHLVDGVLAMVPFEWNLGVVLRFYGRKYALSPRELLACIG